MWLPLAGWVGPCWQRPSKLGEQEQQVLLSLPALEQSGVDHREQEKNYTTHMAPREASMVWPGVSDPWCSPGCPTATRMLIPSPLLSPQPCFQVLTSASGATHPVCPFVHYSFVCSFIHSVNND